MALRTDHHGRVYSAASGSLSTSPHGITPLQSPSSQLGNQKRSADDMATHCLSSGKYCTRTSSDASQLFPVWKLSRFEREELASFIKKLQQAILLMNGRDLLAVPSPSERDGRAHCQARESVSRFPQPRACPFYRTSSPGVSRLFSFTATTTVCHYFTETWLLVIALPMRSQSA